MGTTTSLRDVLFGQTRGSILGLLFGQPDRPFHFQEIRRRIKAAGVGSVQREVRILAEVGIVDRSKVGRQVYYQANRRHPIFPELRALIAKTVGVFEVLRSALEPLRNRIRFAFVYGSFARRDDNGESDLDLLIVGPVSLEEVLEKLGHAERILGRTINPALYSEEEFRERLGSGNHFLTAVVRGEKIFLMGGDDDLKRVA
jgi:predicted nucleotidyltransferase